ncbi:ABC transporter substrate-binding protein [Psychromonas sp. CNPT3]|uniref:ABC transporter substrate-binding protein n=1 Tax=Psychromonas sp. CNPT3 TaxID=314282 RepID=UPI00006E4811|nr:ABC transporter substrate-binding protein [Psychromonas sp. CNPT3]
MRILLVFIASLSLSACYESGSEQKDSLIYCPENAPLSFNPQINHDIATLDASTYQLYNRLIKIDPINRRFVADLATTWSLSADKLTYTFHLRKKVPFHHNDDFTPSRFFNADDVLFSFKRLLDESAPYYTVNRMFSDDSFTQPLRHLLYDVQKVDKHTVKFILKRPNVTLLANLAASYSVILSAQYAQHLSAINQQERIDHYPIGTGPYQFKSATRDIQRYSAFSRYWGEKASIKNLIYEVTPNPTKRYTKLLSGECDVITYPAPSQLKTISANRNIILSSQPTDNLIYLAFNSQKMPFKEKRVRQAISMAIDRETLVNALFFQSATLTNSLLSDHSWAFDPRVSDIEFNSKKSLQALQQTDFDFSKKLIILSARNDVAFSPNFHKTAELVQANLAEIGIESEIISLPKSELKPRLIRGDYDLYLSGINIQSNDPDSLFRPLLSCSSGISEGNSSHWCSNKTEKLINKARLQSRFTRRIQSYYQLQALIQTMRPYLPIAHVYRMDAFKLNIKGLHVDPLAGIDFQHVTKIEEP